MFVMGVLPDDFVACSNENIRSWLKSDIDVGQSSKFSRGHRVALVAARDLTYLRCYRNSPATRQSESAARAEDAAIPIFAGDSMDGHDPSRAGRDTWPGWSRIDDPANLATHRGRIIPFPMALQSSAACAMRGFVSTVAPGSIGKGRGWPGGQPGAGIATVKVSQFSLAQIGPRQFLERSDETEGPVGDPLRPKLGRPELGTRRSNSFVALT